MKQEDKNKAVAREVCRLIGKIGGDFNVIARKLGVSSRSVYRWFSGESQPNAYSLMGLYRLSMEASRLDYDPNGDAFLKEFFIKASVFTCFFILNIRIDTCVNEIEKKGFLF